MSLREHIARLREMEPSPARAAAKITALPHLLAVTDALLDRDAALARKTNSLSLTQKQIQGDRWGAHIERCAEEYAEACSRADSAIAAAEAAMGPDLREKPTCKCGKPHDGWPGADGGELCQDCWEDECSASFWQQHNARAIAVHMTPLEVLAAQIQTKPYAEMTADFQQALIAAVEDFRKLVLQPREPQVAQTRGDTSTHEGKSPVPPRSAFTGE